MFWRRRARRTPSSRWRFLLSLVAYLASGAFLQLSYQRYFFFLVALANATIWMLRREAQAACLEGGAPARAALDAPRAARRRRQHHAGAISARREDATHVGSRCARRSPWRLRHRAARRAQPGVVPLLAPPRSSP